LLLSAVDDFAETLGLKRVGGKRGAGWPHDRAAEIDLVELHRSGSHHKRLLWLDRVDPGAREFQCRVYSHHDSVVIQLVIGKLGDPTDMAVAWADAVSTLHQGFNGNLLEAARQRAIGASAVFWAMADEGTDGWADAHGTEVAQILGGPLERRTDTDLGPLWLSDAAMFPAAPSVSQDNWVLITAADEASERAVQERYIHVREGDSCDFAKVALARHKIAFEAAQYQAEHEALEREKESLERRARWIVRTQTYHDVALADLRSDESEEFQQKLARAQPNLAAYSHAATSVEDLRRTVVVNRTNFLINCMALVAEAGVDKVASSADQEVAANEFLEDWQQSNGEGIFLPELGKMQARSAQLDVDSDYSGRAIARHAASLRSGGEQLDIAGQRELGEIAAHGALQAAAVAASVAALLATELLRTGDNLDQDPILSFNVIALAVAFSFALVELLTEPFRGGLQRFMSAATVGFVLATIAALVWSGDGPPLLVDGVFVVVGYAVGWWLHRSLELRDLVKRRKKRRRRIVTPDLEKLVYATEELPELLEDLPNATTHRIKDPDSIKEKIERKNLAKAAELNMTVEELHARGLAYDITDITDAIGIRYVVRPERIPEVVGRVCAVAHVEQLEYKEVPTDITNGKYRGFRMTYRSVHMDLDLWGVGAEKDVNLVAEVQVRTRIQNWFANWFHDIMYKEQPQPDPVELPDGWRGALLRAPFVRGVFTRARQAGAREGTAPWVVRFFDLWQPRLNRPLARVAIALSDWEMRRHADLMEWGQKPPPCEHEKPAGEQEEPLSPGESDVRTVG
jgi:ppGpp synthetase/RelA/SpoT-type nucleotidyltranferase